jgi:hypothetical protein
MKQQLREVRDILQKNSTEISESLATCASKLSFIDRANLNILCLLAEEKDIDEERGNLGLTLT